MSCLCKTTVSIANFSTELQEEIKIMGLTAADFSDDS